MIEGVPPWVVMERLVIVAWKSRIKIALCCIVESETNGTSKQWLLGRLLVSSAMDSKRGWKHRTRDWIGKLKATRFAKYNPLLSFSFPPPSLFQTGSR